MPTLLAHIQALLFTSGEPLETAHVAKILSVSKKEVADALVRLKAHLAESPESGLMLIETGGKVELATKSELGPVVEALTKASREAALSRAALEVLSIIAYRGPISRSHVEAIRGVNCSFTLRNLLLRGLIDREDNPADARAYLYRMSFAFLETLGLGNVAELPRYEELSADERLTLATEESSSVDPAINTQPPRP